MNPYSNEREANDHERVLKRLNVRFRSEVRARGGGDEERGGGTAEMKMLPEEIG